MNKRIKVIASKLLRIIHAKRSKPWLWERSKPFIFTFHRVISDQTVMNFSPTVPFVKTSTFSALMDYLSREYEALSVKELIQTYDTYSSKGTRRYIMTFDDGWRDNYTEAFPILKTYRIPGTIFLVVNHIGSHKTFWIQQIQYLLLKSLEASDLLSIKKVFENHGLHCNLPMDQGMVKRQIAYINSELKKRPYNAIRKFISDLEEVVVCSAEAISLPEQFLGWEDIKTMSASDIEFGSHTLNHAILTSESKTDTIEEIRESKRILEEKLRRDVYSFAYPDGRFDEEVVQIVKNAGYRCAFKGDCLPGDNVDLFRIPRIDVNENMITNLEGRFSPELFELELSSIYSKVKVTLKGKRRRR